MYNGVLIVRKETGMTSHDVVSGIRKIYHQKKVGHTGTLDPQAEGVLPVCLGKATKLADRLGGTSKTYETELLLGRTTDTQDVFGTTLTETPAAVSAEEAELAVLSFAGTMRQMTPMYSARKVGGKKLVDLARKGIEIERPSREVTFSDIRILSVEMPVIRFSVTCTRGAYIRTLCADIGERLGCGGCMKSLVRTRTGGFGLEDAHTLAEIGDDFGQAEERGGMPSLLLPMEAFFPELPLYRTDAEEEKRVRNGNLLFRILPETGEGDSVRVCFEDGTFAAVYRREGDTLRPELMLLADDRGGDAKKE